MIIRLVLFSAVLLASSAHAQQPTAPETPNRELQPPNDPLKTAPQKAPPGELCLIEGPRSCGDQAEIIRKPYTGEGELYYLERPAKPKPPAAPSLKPPPR